MVETRCTGRSTRTDRPAGPGGSPPLSPRAPIDGVVDVAISIVSHSNRELVRTCLSTISGACSGLTWTATVVENVPGPGSPLVECFPWLQVVPNAVPTGFGENHNRVLAPVVSERRARYVVVLNDDTLLDPDCITALVRYADSHPDIGALGPRLRWSDGREQQSLYSFPTVSRAALAAVQPRWATCLPLEGGCGWLRGACLLLRTDALDRVGLFDDRFFMFFEDADLAARLWDAGSRVEVCQEASMVHAGHQTIRQPEVGFKMECQFLRSSFLYHRKHSGRLASLVVLSASRLGLLFRSALNRLRALAFRDGGARERAQLLLRLAQYSPTRQLPHELQARGLPQGVDGRSPG